MHHAQIEIAIATNADDIYFNLLQVYKPGETFLTGFRLVNALLSGTALQPKDLEKITKICLNSELYKSHKNPLDYAAYYRKKLRKLGVKEDDSPQSKEVYTYPPGR